MTVEIVPLKRWHLLALDLQPTQAHMRAWITDAFADAMEASRACAAMIGGKPVACAGLTPMPGGYAYAWALLGFDARRAMLAATRACEAVLSRETSEVVTHVRPDLPANRRWLSVLGFAATGKCDVLADGMTYELWARRND